MSSIPESGRSFLFRLVFILLALSGSFHVLAQDHAHFEESEIWLVTYGPGEIYWQRFGHNAIWIRDPGLGLDHVFNFGFFDFEQENFFLRFLQGRMLYFSAARPAREEFADYIDENRSIRAQRLDLAPHQKLRLLEYLLEGDLRLARVRQREPLFEPSRVVDPAVPVYPVGYSRFHTVHLGDTKTGQCERLPDR